MCAIHKYLITAKCSFQNIRVFKHSVWFVTDSRGSVKVRSSRLPETFQQWCKDSVRQTSAPASAAMRGCLVNPSHQGWGSVVILQRAGADRTTTGIRVYCSTRCLGAIQTQPGCCEESSRRRRCVGRGRGRGQQGPRTGEEQGARQAGRQPSLLFRMMFVFWHPASSIVISHNITASLGSRTILVASHKR